MPNDFEYASLSCHVYRDGKCPLHPDWEVYMDCPDEIFNLDGYFRVA